MKKILTVILLTFIANVYSQTTNAKDFKKVKFMYLQKSNYEFDEKGVYADSILFIKDFPDIKYRVINNPKDKNLKIAFIPYSSFTEKNMNFMRGLIYHTNIVRESTFSLKRQTTETFCYYCADDETKKIMTLLKSNCDSNKSYLLIKKYGNNGQVTIDNSFEISKKDISKSSVKFSNQNKTIGSYDLDTEDFILTNVVQFDPKLNKHITPIEIFNNSEYGVRKIYSAAYTTELIFISYQ